MTKRQFSTMFSNALNSLCGYFMEVERVRVALFDKSHNGRLVSFDEAIDSLYISSDLFFKVIDLAIFGDPSDEIVFARPAGLKPVPFEHTWDPKLFGPFKLMA